LEKQKVAVLAPAADDIHASDNLVMLPMPESDQNLAQELYALLRQADELGCDVILATLPAEEGIGAAIADRLRRAAGPRD
jgi:L-threonylcarbamoyladenylate synthase